MNSASPLVSIIMPALNAEPWIAEAIDSCLRQTWQNIELIVVDNGSTDHTAVMARQFNSPALRVLECTRPGASAARNAGLDAARGEFIQFLDADDVLDSRKIEVQLTRLLQAPKDTLASGAWARFAARPGERALVPEPVWRDLSPEEFLIESWMGGGMMPIFGWFTPRHLIEAAGPWNEHLSVNDDGEFFARLVLQSAGILFCSDATGYYRTAAKPSTSKSRNHDAMRSALRAIELSCRVLQKRTSSARARRACACQYQRFAFDCYPEHGDLVRKAEEQMRALGGGELKCPGGPGFQLVSALLGWKAARRIQAISRRTQAGLSA